MIIWGTRRRNKELGAGTFFCAKCEADRGYKHFQSKEWFTLYFIPLIPMGVKGEWWECETCNRAYQPIQAQRSEPTMGAQKPGA